MNAEWIRDDLRFLSPPKEDGSGAVGAYYNLQARRVSVPRQDVR